MRILLFGASGAGCSSLGRGLAEKFKYRFFDTDDFYWEPTNPPFITRRDVGVRNAQLLQALNQETHWVLAGSLSSAWGASIIELITFAVFVLAPTEVRVARLVSREVEHYGDRIVEGGDMHATFEKFLAWSAGYDLGSLPGRSRARHEVFLKSLRCSKFILNNTEKYSLVLAKLVEEIAVRSTNKID